MAARRDLAASFDFCRRIARREAKNFYPAFLLLPAGRRLAMCALYAFMRNCDDVADAPGEAEPRRVALRIWREEMASNLGGVPAGDWPGWPALVETVGKYAIPPRHLHEVLDGVEMDLDPRHFATYEDLRIYCHHVASAVGLCCIHIWGFRSEGGKAEALAESCGQALQLTNILRDVGEDARNGRCYLPEADMSRFGVGREDLLAPRVSEPLRELLAFEARRAYEEYERSAALAELIDPVGRPVLRTISGIYRALLDEIARRDYEVLAGRASVPLGRKAAIAVRAFAGRFSRVGTRVVEADSLR